MARLNYIVLLLTSLLILGSCSKRVENPRWVINEVMVENTTNYVDNFGQRNGWIEIYNNTAATQDLGGMFLTTDKGNPKMYAIPLGDVLTKVNPKQHVLFWADDEPFNGTFHTSFKLDPTKENTIYLFDVDGKTLIDELTVPAGLQANATYGFVDDGIKFDKEGNMLATLLTRVTPSSNNKVVGENPKLVDLKENDRFGITLTITSMFVVFFGLLLLYLVFRTIGNIAKAMSRRNAAKTGVADAVQNTKALSGEVLAAISAAIRDMNDDSHDMEDTVLTIERVKRNYSPWNAKRQSLREIPLRK